MKIWNHNTSNESLFGLGVKEATIEIADSNEGPWTLLTDVTLARAPGLPGATATDTIPMMGVMASNVRLTVRSSHGGVATAGLAEVQFFYIPASARELQPEDGAALAGAEVTLAWRGGREAARHEVYLDVNDNRAGVEGSDPAALVATVTTDGPYGSYTASGLNLGKTYVWKIVEINETETPSAWDSDVRTFTTPDYLVVDDFERYTNESPNRVFQAWIDGLGFSPDESFPKGSAGNGTGSAVGHDPTVGDIMETVVVHGGKQAMPVAYDNTSVATSEAQYTLPAWDWTASGIRSLSLFFCGAAGNTGQLYIKINNTKIPYDGDATDLAMSVWQPWNIDLASTGVNLKAVTMLGIGIEGSGAKGVVYIDDIRLYAMQAEKFTPTQPTEKPAAYYSFDGDCKDSSGNARNGTPVGIPTFVAGKNGQALSLGGGDYVTIDNWQGVLGGNPFTISLWVNTTAQDDRTMVCWGTTAGGQRVDFRLYQGRLRVEHGNGNLQGHSALADGQWHHAALVVTQDAPIQQPQVTLYLDGVNDSQETTDPDIFNIVANVPVTIGQRRTNNDRSFLGMLDEVQIFERALDAGEVAWLAGRRMPMHKPF